MGDAIYKPLIDDMTWSYSRVEAFYECPYRWFLKYICGCEEEDRFYSSYGSFMHRLIEEYYRGNITKNEMLTRFLTGFSSEVKGFRPAQDTVSKYIKQGVEYLKGFEPFPYRMIDVEKKFNVNINGIPFVGFIDFLGDDNGDLVIIDNKSRELKPRSNRKKPTKNDLEIDRMLRQLYIYSAAVKEEYGKFPSKLCFNCFRNGVFIEEPFNHEAYEEAIKWAENEIKIIREENDFYPVKEFFSCRWICGVSGECCYNGITSEDDNRR